jgi:hypothetical protein
MRRESGEKCQVCEGKERMKGGVRERTGPYIIRVKPGLGILRMGSERNWKKEAKRERGERKMVKERKKEKKKKKRKKKLLSDRERAGFEAQPTVVGWAVKDKARRTAGRIPLAQP